MIAEDRIEQVRLLPHGLPGRLIIVDGNDGTGKTTLLEGIEGNLRARGLDVLRTRQPTTEARQLDAFQRYIFEPERRDEIDYRALLCMMIGDRLQHAHQVIRPALAAGRVVVCDRYIFTQMVTTRTRGHQDEGWMYELYQHILAPDVGLVADADADQVCRRISARKDSQEAFHERDHVLKNLEEFRRLAHVFGLDVIDTTSLNIPEALDRAIKIIDAVLPPGMKERTE